MHIDINNLRQDNYSDDEIIGILKQNNSLNMDFAKARELGASSTDIVNLYSQKLDLIKQKQNAKLQEQNQEPIIPIQNMNTNVKEPTTQEPNTQSKAYDTLGTNEQEPLIDEQTQKILQNNSIKAPQAPIMPDKINTQKSAWDKASEAILDGISEVGKAAKDIASPLIQAVDGYKQIFNMGEYANTHKARQEELTKKLATKEYLQNGTFALNPFLKSKEESQSDKEALINFFNDEAIKLGFKPKIKTERNGEVKFGIELADGKVRDITPGFMDAIMPSKNEIVGSIGGTLASAAVLGLTKNPALAGEASAYMRALAHPTTKIFAGGAVGSGVGALQDYRQNTALVGEEATLQGASSAMLGGVANEALGVGMAEAVAKAIPQVNKLMSVLPKYSDKAINFMPVLKQLRTQNISGAMRELEKQVGGKAELEAILAKANEAGVVVDISDASYVAKMTKDKLGDAEKFIDKLDETTQNQTLKKGLSFAKKLDEVAIKGVSYIEHGFLSKEAITDAQSKILTIARANSRVGEMLGSILSQNATAANNLKQMINTDTDKIFKELESISGDRASIKQVAKEYVDGVKAEFDEMLDVLSTRYEGIKTTLPDTPNAQQFLDDIQVLKDSSWKVLSNRNLKAILNNLENSKEIQIADVNTLRTELNKIIANSDDFSTKDIARSAKAYVENDVLDDILGRLELGEEAKKLYKEAVAQYKDMKVVENSLWYKNRVAGARAGDYSDTKVAELALKEFNKAVNKDGSNLGSVAYLLNKISPEKAASIELEFIEQILTQNTFKGEGVKAINLSEAIKAMGKIGFKSEEAKGFNALLKNLEPIINQDIHLASSTQIFKQQEKFGTGIGYHLDTKAKVWISNRTIKNIIRLLPILGDQPSLIHHLNQAALKAKDYKGFINEVKIIGSSPTTPSGIKTAINEYIRAADDLQKQYDSVVGNAEKQTEQMPSKNDTLEKAELKNENLTQNNQNFTIQGNQAAKSDLTAKFELAPNVRDLSKLTTDEISADLEYLASKHPEIFSKPSEVFKLIREIKNEPTHYFRNYRLDAALIAKRLENNKVGKLAINKDSGEVIHATKVRERDLHRMDRVSKQTAGTSTLPTPLKATDEMPLKQDANSAGKAYSSASDEIIPQQTSKSEASLQNKGKNITKISQNELTADMLKQIEKNNQRVAVGENLNPDQAVKLGFKYPNDVRRTIGADEIRHTLNRHGENSPLVKSSGQKAVTLEDIAKWQEFSDTADMKALSKDNMGQSVLISGKQINGHYVVVESVRTKGNELAFKTMYFEKGELKDSKAFKEAQTLLYGYEPNANSFASLKTDEIIPQQTSKSEVFLDEKFTKAYEVANAKPTEFLKEQYLKKLRDEIEAKYNITPIKEFGTNYAEFYHDGVGAVNKLLAEKNGQVAGAFYKEGLGDIDLVWGKVLKDEKGQIQGYGLAKIKEKHPEITPEILDDVIKIGEIKTRQNEAVQIIKDNYKIILKSNWMGEPTKNKWVLSAYENSKGKSSSISSDDFTKADNLAKTPNDEIIPQQTSKSEVFLDEKFAKDYEIANSKPTLALKEQYLQKLRDEIEAKYNITPIKEFGTNYAEFYHDGVGAVNKLLAEKNGQVAGAFYKEGLGDIDLVWGDDKIGLNKILSKHADDFKEFGGVGKGLDEIVNNGEVVSKNGVETIILNKNDKIFKIGLSKGWNDEGKNDWIITAYEFKKEGNGKTPDDAIFTAKQPLANPSEDIIPKNEIKSEMPLENGLKDDINEWVITAYKKEKEPSRSVVRPSSDLGQNGTDLSANGLNKIIPQQTSKSEVFKDEKFAKAYEVANAKPTEFLKEQYLQKLRDEIEAKYNITPIKEFGTNYAEFYHDGVGAVNKLLTEKQGQVAGAFWRDEIGDITLHWGDVGSGKSDGSGLAKIVKFHPEVLNNLDELVQTLPIKKETQRRYQLENENYKVGIRKDFNGDNQNWVLTAFEKKDSIARRTTDLSSSQSDKGKTAPLDTDEIIPQQTSKSEVFLDEKFAKDYEIANSKPTLALKEQYLQKLRDEIEAKYNITPIKEFGTNYAEFYHDGVGAVNKLLAEKNGQVAGAFYKEGLGDIDLVWGDDKIGLNKILSKHADDFKEFGGVGKGLDEIVNNGEVVSNASVKTILYTNKNGKFRVGLSKGWHGKGENEWVITAYKKEKEPSRSVVRPSSDLGQNGTDLSANGLNKIIPQQTSKSENLTQNNQNFTIQGNQATKSDLNVNVSVDDWVKELSQINSNELTANLFILQQKHPELFKKPSDVYKMLVQIKNNPTHFFKNNRPDMALIAKILQDGSVGKMAIVKDSGKVSHITKSTKDRELKRLQNVNERELGAGSPYPTQQSSKTLPANGDGAKAHSLATDEIILQQELKSEISSQISLDGINDVVKNLAQNRDIALKLNPKADILNLVNDFKEPIKTPLFTSKISLDKMLNHLAQKPDFDRRIEYINLVKPTLENPLFITKEGDRYRFVKTFLDDKDKVVKFLSVIEDDKGEFIGITATPLKNTDVKNILKGDIVWGGDMLTNQSTPRIANLQALSTEGKGLDAIDEIIPQQTSKSEVFLDEKFAKDYEIANSKPTLALKEQYLQKLRDEIEAKYNITPIKEFGTNYAEFYHDGVGAVNKLLAEKNGQVAGAFYKEGLGDIDLVWGDDKFGLKHILEQRGKQWTEQKALKFVSHLGEIINEATITKGRDGTIELITPKSTAILSQKGDNKFILTAFRDSGNKKRLESGSYQTFHDDNFTDKSVSVRKETDILSSNHNKEGNGKTPDDAIFTAKQPLANPSDEIIPQQTSKSEVFKDEKFAKAYEVANAKPTEFLKEQYLQKLRDEIEAKYNITPIKEFGTNYAEFYHDGVGAVNKLLAEKNGQVTGAFYKEGLGDIDLVWGKVLKDEKGQIQGYGLAKIKEKHPEITPEILDEVIEKGEISQTHNGYNITHKNYIVGLNQGWNENRVRIGNNKWIVTAFDDSLEKATSKAPVDSFDGKNAAFANSDEIIPQVDKILANAHIGSGLISGVLNSKDENGEFNPENFVKGFLYGAFGSKVAGVAIGKLSPKLYNKFLGLSQQFPQMAKGNPKLLGKIYAKAPDSSINSFAGQRALTANKARLSEALKMVKNGVDEATIWQKTGWFKDELDDKWKFEINPKGGQIINKDAKSLGEFLKDDELFSAYPELKDIRVLKLDDVSDNAMMSVKDATQKQKRGIYNVTHNNKKATYIKQDLQSVENALRYAKGDKSKGAEHIKIRHMSDSKRFGYVSNDELLNLGESIRKYVTKYGEPFIDDKGGRVYEWADKDGVRFRLVVYEKRAGVGSTPDITSTSPYESIITFYSDRNIKKPMEFKNPKVAYEIANSKPTEFLKQKYLEWAKQKEKRGIYNVAFNDKKSTIIYKDLENIEQIIKFEKGKTDQIKKGELKSGYGALHIQKHLNKNADGWVTSQEYLNMGQMLRKATMQEVKNKRVYTYFDDNNVRFRIIVGNNKNNERVISFYSNRKAGLNYNSQNYDDNLPKKEILEQNSLKFNKDSEREI